MKNNTSSTGALILATLGGVALGSAIGILFAPDKGKHTRRKLTGRAASSLDEHLDDIISEGKKSWKKLKDSAEDTSDDIETYLTHLVEEGKKSWYQMQADMEAKAADAQDKTESTVNKAVREGKRLWNNFTNKAESVASDAKEAVEDAADYAKEKVNGTQKYYDSKLS